MANVKNFGLIGVGSTVQFGKAGPSLGQESATVLRADGTAAFRLPVGTVGQRPTGAAGMIRFNDDVDQMEYYNGTTWATLATGGAAVEEVAGVTGRITVDSTDPTAPIVNIASTYAGQSSITTLGTIETGTWQGTVVGPTYGGTGVNNDASTITLGGSLTTSGAFASTFAMTGTTAVTFPTTGTLATVAQVDAVRGELDETQASLGPGVNANGTFNNSGFTGAGLGTVTSFTDAINVVANAAAGGIQDITLTGPVAGLTVTETGTATAPIFTFALANNLAALEGLATTGYIVRTGGGTAVTRAVEGNAGRIVVTNGTGVSSDTSIDLDTVTNPSNGGSFVKVTTDIYGRVTNSTTVVAADITSLVDATYVNVTGDTMANGANLIFATGGTVQGLPTPIADTDAANKAYVDATAAGLSWKQAVAAATDGPGTLASDFENGDILDGVTLVTGMRILIKDQADGVENGIYIVQASGAPVRSTDADTGTELDGAAVFVLAGTANDNSGWTQTVSPVTIGTTAQGWSQFSGSSTYVWGVGLEATGNTVNINLGAGITELPTDEIGIDLFDSSTGALILTASGTDRVTTSAGRLQLLLASGSGLSQGAAGLTISAAGVTNGMLVNNGITTNGDTGTGALDLGGELEIAGTSTHGIITSVIDSVFTLSSALPSGTQRGTAAFNTTNFSVSGSGVVSLAANGVNLATDVTGILPVANGGTAVSTLGANQVMIGNGTDAVLTSSALTFAAGLLTVGGAAPLTIDGVTGTIASTATNGNINLVPNGIGAVVIGPAGSGVIAADVNESLTVTGNNTLVLSSTAGNIVMTLAAGIYNKVTVAGPTATDYASDLADEDLVNKFYVDTVAGSAAGDVKAVRTTFSLAANGTFNIGSALPAGATILSVKANVTAADTGTGTLSVGKVGSVAAYMTTDENDTQSTGLYVAETMVTEAASEQVIGTVAGGPAGAGSVTVVVTYQLA